MLENLTNPALLFFLLGIIATQVRSDLKIPETSSKFISIYLLFAIGFKGGQELSHAVFSTEILWTVALAILMASIVPLYTYYILRMKLNVENAGAVAASYGSVSAVTFLTGISFLEMRNISYDGHMIALMALMESPAIIIGISMISFYNKGSNHISISSVLKHSLTNASVLIILGSMFIGFLTNDKQAAGIKPFTTDLFKGFLMIFLLDMGITAGRELRGMLKNGVFLLIFSVIIPFINGMIALLLISIFVESEGSRILFALLGASASYIAVPATMKIVAPNSNPGIYLPMALGITFPINIILGIPFYHLINQFLF